MAAEVVYTFGTNVIASFQGSLFKDKVFWIAQRTPSRSRYVSLVESNGGTVAPLEKNADYLICDHLRKDNPSGAISYKFIEESVQNGRIADPDAHACGPARGAPRPVGAPQMTRNGRVSYSTEDDHVLYSWVKECQAKGGKELGNTIFQQLGQINTRHTWQSWRDRYIKKLRDNPPSSWEESVVDKSRQLPSTDDQSPAAQTLKDRGQAREQGHDRNDSPRMSINPPPRPRTPESLRLRRAEKQQAAAAKSTAEQRELGFLANDLYQFLDNFEYVSTMPQDEFVKAWDDLAASENGKPFTSEDWQDFFKLAVTGFHQKYMKDEASKERILNEMDRWIQENDGGTIEAWQGYWKQNRKQIMAGEKAADSHSSEIAEKGRPTNFALDGQASSSPKKASGQSPAQQRSRKRTLEVDLDQEELPPDSPVSTSAKRRKIAPMSSRTHTSASGSHETIEEEPSEEANGDTAAYQDLLQTARGALQHSQREQDETLQVAQSSEPVLGSEGSLRKPTTSSIQGELASQQIITESSLRSQPSPVQTTKPQQSTTNTQEEVAPEQGSTPRAGKLKGLVDRPAVASPQGSYRMLKAAGTPSQLPDTQATFNIDTQDLELDMVEPDGGFEDNDNGEAPDDSLTLGTSENTSQPLPSTSDIPMTQAETEEDVEMSGQINDDEGQDVDSSAVPETDGAEASDRFARQALPSSPSKITGADDLGSTSEILATDRTAQQLDSQSDVQGNSQLEARQDETTGIAADDAMSVELGGDEHEQATAAAGQPSIAISSDHDSITSESDDSSDEESNEGIGMNGSTPQGKQPAQIQALSAPRPNQQISPLQQSRRRTLPFVYAGRPARPTPNKPRRSVPAQPARQRGTTNPRPRRREQQPPAPLPTNLPDLITHLENEGVSLDRHIKPALRATCANLELTAKVARSLRLYSKLPENVPGVWTETDDRELRTRGVKSDRIVTKHGEMECEIREEWLERLAS